MCQFMPPSNVADGRTLRQMFTAGIFNMSSADLQVGEQAEKI